jgi:glycosyltransferase involved in cell wall biosynthesis
MRIVFFIIDYVPHQLLSIKSIAKIDKVEIMAFHVQKFIDYLPENIPNFISHHYLSKPKDEILNDLKDFNPNIVITAGWMIQEYNWLCQKIRKCIDIPVVAMTDTPWYGRWRQKIHSLISPFYTQKMFTHLWVAGIKQYDYARKLGFKNDHIIFNCLSADLDVFNKVDIDKKKSNYPKNFIFIGRFIEIKGLRNLMEAWSLIQDKKEWTFTLIGSGEMKKELVDNGNFIVKDHISQDLLINEMQNSGCFVLPSLREPWALVIHEAAAAGLPIVCTETCGAASHFVINNYNGLKVENNSIKDLKLKLENIINMDMSDLINFGNRSRLLSNSITPDIQTASLLQLIK